MIDFSLSEEQKALQEMARDFARERIAPVAQELDQQSKHPQELINEAHALGLMNLTVPEEYNGGGLGAFEDCLIAEEFGAACAGVATTVMGNSLALAPIVLAGTPAQLEQFVAPFCAGPNLAAFCLTEAGAGSDVASIRTTVHREGDEYVINGSKRFITNGGVSSLYAVFATLNPELKHKGICAFIVPGDTPGLSYGKKEDKMGQRASDTREVIFDNVRIPVTNRLGEEGQGFLIAMQTLDRARAGVAALALGVARAALEASLQYAQQRQQFGQPIAKFQAIQFMLADMAIKVETARLMVWKAAWMTDRGQPPSLESSIAKCYASDIAMEVTTDAVQIFGGYGYIKEYPVEKYMRDAKLMQIYEGTNQIQRLVIARNLFRR